jgi:hypothetical protein
VRLMKAEPRKHHGVKSKKRRMVPKTVVDGLPHHAANEGQYHLRRIIDARRSLSPRNACKSSSASAS